MYPELMMIQRTVFKAVKAAGSGPRSLRPVLARVTARLKSTINRNELYFLAENKWFHTKRSSIHGTGCFASKNIDVDVCLGASFVRSDIEFDFADMILKPPQYAQFDGAAPHWSNIGLLDYMNHSDTAPLAVSVLDTKTLVLRTIREIKQGEEVTCNYGDVYKLVGASPPEF